MSAKNTRAKRAVKLRAADRNRIVCLMRDRTSAAIAREQGVSLGKFHASVGEIPKHSGIASTRTRRSARLKEKPQANVRVVVAQDPSRAWRLKDRRQPDFALSSYALVDSRPSQPPSHQGNAPDDAWQSSRSWDTLAKRKSDLRGYREPPHGRGHCGPQP